MDFGSAHLFNKTPEDMRRVGALGGRARARNLRLRQAPVDGELSRPHEETAAEATLQLAKELRQCTESLKPGREAGLYSMAAIIAAAYIIARGLNNCHDARAKSGSAV